MKIFLTGSTGLISNVVLARCLASPAIDSILTLTRRSLPTELVSNTKIKSIVRKDFANYPEDDNDDLAHEFRSVDACIWALGKARGTPSVPPRDVDIGYTMA